MSKKADKEKVVRERSQSSSTLTEFLKRKRGDELPEEFEKWENEQLVVFQKSKKTARSPKTSPSSRVDSCCVRQTTSDNKVIKCQKENLPGEDMDTILRKLEELKEELKLEFSKQSEELKLEFNRKNEEIKNEFIKVKEEWKRKQEQWTAEKVLLEERIKELEKQSENQEREKRKLNIVIKGGHPYGPNITKSVEDLLVEKLQIRPRIQESFKIGKGDNAAILVKMQDWEAKTDIMKAKNKLRGTKIVIENDMTRAEREIQMQIRTRAKEEKQKGKQVKIGYNKIIIESEEWKWNMLSHKLEKHQTKN